MSGLTVKQAACLTFIADFSDEHGFSPSYREIADFLGLVSVSGVHRRIAAMVERGYLRTLPGHARSLEVVKRPKPNAVTLNTLSTSTLEGMQREIRVILLRRAAASIRADEARQ